MNITLLAKKGGVGKSTVCILLYEAFRQAGKTVSIHDWDAQGTSTKALELFGAQMPPAGRKADIVHIATATAVRNADVALAVTSPAPADIWEAEEAVLFVQSRNSQAAARLVFNKVRKATVLGRLVDESARQVSVPSLPVMLSDRECYKHAIAQGWKALDHAAREEVLQFTVALLALKS
jgi:MinD-like ATPase involved in chromosome partitioning or flagellar assembly